MEDGTRRTPARDWRREESNGSSRLVPEGEGFPMRVIAVEEHFTTEAFREANADHPFIKGMFAPTTGGGGPGEPSPGAGLLDLLLDIGELRLASMDAAGIDVQVISQTTPGPESLEPSLAVRLAVEANDVAAAAVAAHPDRFAAFATL